MAAKNKNETKEQEIEILQTDKENALFPEKPQVLIALRPVLYLSHQYKIGDTLPVNNLEMVKAWIEARSAEWREKDTLNQFP